MPLPQYARLSLWLLFGALFLALCIQRQPIHITEGRYEGAGHFIIHTPAATYYYDKAGGGLSRLIDPAGNDWIAFKRVPWNEYPASAASAYRGLPNFVFGSDDSGAGHPGHEMCESKLVDERTIRTTSRSGKWQWEWTFFKDYAKVEVLKTDPEQPYWFLYEGTPGGEFDPSRQFYGTNAGGPRRDQLDYYAGNKAFENWQWAYFGHEAVERVLFVVQEEADELSDTFSYLGNTGAGITSPDGMVVFGFGRADGAKPLLRKAHTFYVGFVEYGGKMGKVHRKVDQRVRKLKE